MKKTFLFIIAIVMFVVSFAQNNQGKSDDIARISIAPIVPQQIEGMPEAARSMLKNKLQQIVTKNGLGSINSQFFITANVTIVSKDITPTAPPMIAMNLEITFYITDYINKSVFSTTSIEKKGVGKNETKAYIEALKTINYKDPQFKAFLDDGKKKIIEYYNSNCDFIIKEAQTMAAAKEYGAAIYKLVSVPNVCKECYEKCMDEVKPIFKLYEDQQCGVNLAKAKASWAKLDANEASSYLSNISPDASCYADAQKLVNEIKTKMLADEKKEWDFKMKIWDDSVDLEKQRIDAYREVGVAQAEHQPEVQYNFSYLW